MTKIRGYMQPGGELRVEIDKVGILRTPILPSRKIIATAEVKRHAYALIRIGKIPSTEIDDVGFILRAHKIMAREYKRA